MFYYLQAKRSRVGFVRMPDAGGQPLLDLQRPPFLDRPIQAGRAGGGRAASLGTPANAHPKVLEIDVAAGIQVSTTGSRIRAGAATARRQAGGAQAADRGLDIRQVDREGDVRPHRHRALWIDHSPSIAVSGLGTEDATWRSGMVWALAASQHVPVEVDGTVQVADRQICASYEVLDRHHRHRILSLSAMPADHSRWPVGQMGGIHRR